MKILEEVGLTKKEAEVYQTLLSLGESPVHSLIKATGSHPQVVYRAIDSLKDKGLLLITKKKHKTYVEAENPRVLQKMQEEKVQRLKNALPELLSLTKPGKESLVRVSKGEEAIRAFRTNAISSLKRNDTLYIIGGSGDRFYDIMGKRHAEIEEKRIKKHVHKKLISFSNEKDKFMKDQFRQFSEFRYLPHHFPVTTSTNIFHNTVGIIIWASEPILITIENEEVAKSYREYFDQLWQICK